MKLQKTRCDCCGDPILIDKDQDKICETCLNNLSDQARRAVEYLEEEEENQ